jgi:ribosomal-protein-alanine N-acetyltransferase
MVVDDMPVFETERLTLRRLLEEDSVVLLERYSEPQDSEFMLFGPFSDEKSATAVVTWATKLICEKQGLLWGICEKRTGKLIGILDYRHTAYHEGLPYRSEIGYDLSQSYWGKGLMVEAAKPTIDHVLGHLQVRRIEATVDVLNFRSIRVLQKLGFHFEGILRDYGCRQGQFYDAAVLSLLRAEYRYAR